MSTEYSADVLPLTNGSQETQRGGQPTFFGALTTPKGEEVRRYYEARSAAHQRRRVVRRVAMHLKAVVHHLREHPDRARSTADVPR
jgi:hypothetical protein